jgi:H/ACA ribonucleoprotein complex subunit 4
MVFFFSKKSKSWPLLLKNLNFLNIKDEFFLNKDFKNLCKNFNNKDKFENSIFIFDKPCGWNSFEISKWLKKLLKVDKAWTLENTSSFITGCLIILFKFPFNFSNFKFKLRTDYVCIFKINNWIYKKKFDLSIFFKNLNGNIFQLPFFSPLAKRQIRLGFIYYSFLKEINIFQNSAILEISCNLKFSIESLFFNLGFSLENNFELIETRKIRLGNFTEEENLITLHDILDSNWSTNCLNKIFYLQKNIFSMDILFTNYKRIIVKNSAINSLCYGANLNFSGMISIEKNIENEEKILLISAKGEIVGLGISKINLKNMFLNKKKSIATIKILLMKKDFYPKRWGIGIFSLKSNILNSIGIKSYIKNKNFKILKWWGGGNF